MKKRVFFTLLSVCLLGFPGQADAQLSTNEEPVSFNMLQKQEINLKPVSMPVLNMAKIAEEDKEDEEYDMPLRFGFPHRVNFDLTNSGTWQTLPNGDKLWQLNVVCPGALSVNFCYDKFWIPEGGKLFIYTKDRKHSIGAFTSQNNKGSRENLRGFATGLVYGNDVILEYYQPKEVTLDAVISIEYVVHGYRYIKFDEKSFGNSGNCMVNVNCEEGEDWQNEKKAVARIIIEGAYYCTGALVTTTNLSGEPFFLTANHCIKNVGDATGDADLDYTFFYWNYEAPGCSNVNVEPTLISTSGAKILANNTYSDFALLKLTEDPQMLPNYTPYYLGWDCSGLCGEQGVCIHHPKGDVKKISTVAQNPVSSDYLDNGESSDGTHWRVMWRSTLNGNGTTEGGSSGSPLFNSDHLVIGQLHGGYSGCGEDVCLPDWYGKFDLSWSYDNSIYRSLSSWLDSLNVGNNTMEGLLIVKTVCAISEDMQNYGNIRITNSGELTIHNSVELMGNSRVIVEPGGQLIIDGGTLSNVELALMPGSVLRVINGGTIETRNGFTAPIGSVVDVEYGQIL